METLETPRPQPLRRPWKERESSSGDASVFAEAGVDAASAVADDFLSLSPLTRMFCAARGLKTDQEIQQFLSPDITALKDPFSLKDMEKAVERMIRAKNAGEKVLVYGDYDVDGTTGAALLSWFLRDCGFAVEVKQPDRFRDGYGVHPKHFEEYFQQGVRVVLSVDCGITGFAAAETAQQLGLDWIILDHHQVDPIKGVPSAYAVVDPHQADCPSGLTELCGCGLAFYFARAYRARAKDQGLFLDGKLPNLKQHLDLVVLATAADMVPLVRDNHILARAGLEVLRNTQKPGVRALMDVAGLSRLERITPSSLGFAIGPRINASGRVANASHALELLSSKDPADAARRAFEIEQLNQNRQQLQLKIWESVREIVDEGLKQGKYKNSIVVGHKDWHEGVVGIVASRVVETYHRPACVISFGEEKGKGSLRTFAGKNVLEGLRKCAHLLLGFGGHTHAAGVALHESNFEEFAVQFDAAMESMQDQAALRPLWYEGEASLSELDFKTFQELEALGPFGVGHSEPVFLIRGIPSSVSILKDKHYRFRIQDPYVSHLSCAAIWFSGKEKVPEFDKINKKCLFLAVPELNRFRGEVTPTLRVMDVQIENDL